MDRWWSLAEQKIRDAMEQGDFSNLPGRGKPLRLRVNPFEPPELHLAHIVLEAANMVPAWIDERKQIDLAVEQALASLRDAWLDDPETAAAEFRQVATALNKRILTYNLQVPAGGFQRLQLDIAWEVRRAAAGARLHDE